MDNHILFGYAINGDRTGSALDGNNFNKAMKAKKLTWVHLDAALDNTEEWLADKLDHLDPFIVSALIADETRPRMTQINDGAIVILRGVNLNSGSQAEDMVSVRLYVDQSQIISLQARNIRGIMAIKEAIENGKGPKDGGEFLSELVQQLTSRFETVLSELDYQTDEIEEKLLIEADIALRQDIVGIRKKAIVFRRHMSPQREAISQLRMTELGWLSDLHKRSLQQSYNHILRYVEELDAIRERAQIVKDELANMIGDKLNKNTYVLSVIAAVFLPLGFLTGLFGINIGGMPGVENPFTFTHFSLFLVVWSRHKFTYLRSLNGFKKDIKCPIFTRCFGTFTFTPRC